MNEKFETWLTDNLCEIMDEETADFAFEQGEKYMYELQQTAKAIVDRSYLMLGVIITVCPLFITTSLAINNHTLSVISYILTAFCIGLSIYLTGIVKPSRSFCLGRDPKGLLRIENLKHKKESRYPVKLYELENLQQKIEGLIKENEYKAKQQTIAMYAVVAALSFCLIISTLL